MGQYVVKRLFLFIPTLFLVTALVFVIMRIVPGDPALIILLGDLGDGAYTERELAELRHLLGTDRPIITQYGTWIWDLVRGDFGVSMFYLGDPVWEEISQKFPNTLELVVLGLIFGFGLAVPIGVLSAVKQDTWIDYVARMFSIAFVGMPTFWVGILVIFFLVRWFDWLPPIYYVKLWEDPLTNIQQMVFPAIVLGLNQMAFVARVTRSAMLDVLREDYIRTAQAKGLRQMVVIFRHALKNAFLPVLTVGGYQIGRLIGGTVVIELVFLVPGIGTVLVDSIIHRDLTMVQGIIFIIGFGVLCINLIIDMMYAWLDPRIRYT